jgi:hypothetical protein
MKPGMGAATWVEADAELTFDAVALDSVIVREANS